MIRNKLHDFGKAFFIGAAGGMAAALGLFAAGAAVGGGDVLNGLETARNGLMLVGALGLLILAGMLLIKGKKPETFTADEEWRRQFKAAGIKSVMGMVCAGILMAAGLVDYLQSEYWEQSYAVTCSTD